MKRKEKKKKSNKERYKYLDYWQLLGAVSLTFPCLFISYIWSLSFLTFTSITNKLIPKLLNE